MTGFLRYKPIAIVSCIAFAAFFMIHSFGEGRPRISAAKEINSEGPYTYGANNAYDRNIQTAWCTNKLKSKDSWLRVSYDLSQVFSGVGLINGYVKNIKIYQNNSRPKEGLIYVDEKLVKTVTLSDDMSPQWTSFEKTAGQSIKFVIDSVYAGEKHSDICITEIFDNQELFTAYKLLADIRRRNKTYRSQEIKRVYAPFFAATYQVKHARGAKPIFWQAVRLRVSNRDKSAFRTLLDLSHFSQSDLPTLDAELVEGLRDMMVPFLLKESKVVIRVLQDSEQVARDRVTSAYNDLVSNFAYDPATGKITDPSYTKDLQEIGRIISGLRLGNS